MAKTVCRRLVTLLLATVLLLTAAVPCMAESTKRTVRVGIFSLGKFQYLNESGAACGYNADYLAKIAQIAHWNYEYIPVENWIDATNKLESGEIDLLAPAQATEALKSRFAFTAYEMGTEFGAIYVPAERDDLLYGDTDAMSRLTYGIAENSTFARQFVESYCAEAGFVPNTASYANTTELMSALKSGEVDAIVTNIMFAEDGLKILGRFTPLPVYYITAKGNDALLRELDDALTTLRFTDPDLSGELMKRYFPIIQNTQLTYEEQEFVKNAPVITVGYVVNHEPLSYQDENGEFAGISRDILDRIAEISGLHFQYTALPAAGVTYDYLVERNIHVLSNVEYNAVNESNQHLILSTPYLQSEKILVAESSLQFDEQSVLRVAVATGSGTLPEVIRAQYPNFAVQQYDTAEECFEAVRTGRADALMQNRYVAERLLDKPIYSDMSVIPIQSLNDSLCLCTMEYIGQENDETLTDGTIINIVDKSIRQITTEEINSIVITNTSHSSYQITTGDFIYRFRYMIAAFFLLAVFIFILQARLTRMKTRQNALLEQKNRELGDAVSMAQRANVAKSQFLSRMSHEIRTPMNAIVGITAIAQMHTDDPQKIKDYLGKIDVSSKVLLSIINDVLDMSAIESDKIRITHDEFDIKQVIGGITALYYPQCRDKDIRFETAVDLGDELLIGDSLRVNQVLMNLVSNAYKFTGRGGTISMVVTEQGRKAQQVFVRFTVSDTGCGMSEEMLERLFLPFEQESGATAREHGGSGLGMSIAKNLVDLMHGAINVKSKKGEGTTFTVDIPFEISSRAKRINTKALADLRALVVDDDETARKYTGLVLEHIGLRYGQAQNGETALRMLSEAHDASDDYDICFLDWKMPGMDGIEVTQKIRSLYGNAIKIIITSAYELSDMEDTAKQAGADLLLTKPVFQSAAFEALMNLAGGKPAEETPAHRTYDFTGHKVLLAEDNMMNAEIATDLLALVNLAVDHAENGEQAVEMLRSSAPGTYGAILMDVQMPVMNGYEATTAIRRLDHPQAAEIPIFAMTANAFTEDISLALSAGMNGHIAKPINTDILYETLAKAILD